MPDGAVQPKPEPGDDGSGWLGRWLAPETGIRLIRERRADLPTIVTTGYIGHMPEKEAGRLVVLHKPYRFASLIGQMKALLSHNQP